MVIRFFGFCLLFDADPTTTNTNRHTHTDGYLAVKNSLYGDLAAKALRLGSDLVWLLRNSVGGDLGSPNLDRRLVLIGEQKEQEGDGEQEEEEEYVIEEEEDAVQGPCWMAVARFYSGQVYKTGVLFNELSKAWVKALPVPVRELRDNRFLVEFDSEWLWKKVIFGGPWTFRGDAVIFVPYDGLQRFSEVVIESIALWIRVYDILERLMLDGFVRSLGNKVGKVLEIAEARMDYKRVKVDFPLDKPIVAVVKRKVQGRGIMEFNVRYENIPHFCFLCERIGHADRECPDEAEMEGGVKFGTALRCSPQKVGYWEAYNDPGSRPKINKGSEF
ncbi:hypothetical protein HU200_029084 [Digitaria exilis]|uniref:CCHC-type domain-containing protein n=1 Tax=Digitaria exilis TaxID=1010633 RepID=A0A835BTB6_9POAL|nr:hypothetical protein HU200_029084 [Digitaria exilis]